MCTVSGSMCTHCRWGNACICVCADVVWMCEVVKCVRNRDLQLRMSVCIMELDFYLNFSFWNFSLNSFCCAAVCFDRERERDRACRACLRFCDSGISGAFRTKWLYGLVSLWDATVDTVFFTPSWAELNIKSAVVKKQCCAKNRNESGKSL